MKRNVQIYDKDQLRKILNSQGIKHILRPSITKDGDYVYTGVKMVRTDGWDGKWEFMDCILYPNEIALSINMPLWEVVMVDNDGNDEYALMFYE